MVFSGSAARGAFQMTLPGGGDAVARCRGPGRHSDALVVVARRHAHCWSAVSPSGGPTGVAIYDFAAKTTTQVSADPSYAALWMADNRRVIYFTNGGWQLAVVDTITGIRTLLLLRLPAPSTIDIFALSRDNRHVYYGGASAEADIWILERK